MTPRSQFRKFLALAAVAVIAAACSGTGASPSTPASTSDPFGSGAPSAAPSSAASAPASGGPSAAASAPASAGGSGATASGSCPTAQPAPLGANETRTVTIKTAKGDITIKVDAKSGPIATGNFVALAECGYYDNVVFHRLVPGFVVQAGDGQYGRAPNVDPNHVGEGGPGYTIQDEPVKGDYLRGTVAMARTPQPNSQGSQFFICLDDLSQSLPKSGGYVILGTVTGGMDVVDAIAAEPNSGPPNNAATSPEPMTSVTVATP